MALFLLWRGERGKGEKNFNLVGKNEGSSLFQPLGGEGQKILNILSITCVKKKKRGGRTFYYLWEGETRQSKILLSMYRK